MGKRNFETYGNVAYSTSRRQSTQPSPQRSPRSSPANFTRKKVQVRQKDEIAPFAILGFATSCLLAGLLMTSYAHLTTTSDEVVQLRRELSNLETEQATLSAQYEKLFDINRIEETVGVQMMRPGSDQVVYLDLAQPDNVTIYDAQRQGDSFFTTLKEIVLGIFA